MHVRVSAAVKDEKAAWRLLSALDRLHEWAPDVAASPAGPLVIGTVRMARLEEPVFGQRVLRERIIAVTPRSFTYEIEGGIGPLRSVHTTWAVEHGHVTVSSLVELAWYARPFTAKARQQWIAAMRSLLDGFTAAL